MPVLNVPLQYRYVYIDGLCVGMNDVMMAKGIIGFVQRLVLLHQGKIV